MLKGRHLLWSTLVYLLKKTSPPNMSHDRETLLTAFLKCTAGQCHSQLQVEKCKLHFSVYILSGKLSEENNKNNKS